MSQPETKCPRCGGSGEVYQQLGRDYRDGPPVPVRCPQCYGNGVIETRERGHDARLAARDRQDDHAPADAFIKNYMERVTRHRYYRDQAQETEAQNTLRPRTGNVTPHPRTAPTTTTARVAPRAA